MIASETDVIAVTTNSKSTSFSENSQEISYHLPVSMQTDMDDSDGEGYESERTIAVRMMVSTMCLHVVLTLTIQTHQIVVRKYFLKQSSKLFA